MIDPVLPFVVREAARRFGDAPAFVAADGWPVSYTELDRCSDEAFAAMGLGPDYAKERRLTSYTAEAHICYVQELHLVDKVRVGVQLRDHDEKRVGHVARVTDGRARRARGTHASLFRTVTAREGRVVMSREAG